MKIAQKAPLGWNSFDSYSIFIHEDDAQANLDVFIQKLKPAGYEYFVIDAGWYILKEREYTPADLAIKEAQDLCIDEWGHLQPSPSFFPSGIDKIIQKCHGAGIKFGIHMMRGIPRKSVKRNTPIKGTQFHARDIANTNDTCLWCSDNYGIDMSKPGAQEFYDSFIQQFADWGVDFIKADDIVPFPDEIDAVVKAIEKCGRPMVLSLSPGGKVDPAHIDVFTKANMLRVTHDIWDNQIGIDQAFTAWKKWTGKSKPGFWIDLDMLPLGQLQMVFPKPENTSGAFDKKEALKGEGYNRWCQLTQAQQETFVTMRALAASPLFMGGDLPSLPDETLQLITNSWMLQCQQNGLMGNLVFVENDFEIWHAPETNQANRGWFAVFNRKPEKRDFRLQSKHINSASGGKTIKCHDIWRDEDLNLTTEESIDCAPNGCRFFYYSDGFVSEFLEADSLNSGASSLGTFGQESIQRPSEQAQ